MEIRGVWLPNTDSLVLTSKQRITEAMEFLAETGFNVVFPVVWSKGYTVYPSQVMGELFGVEIDPRYRGRDPLGELIEEAKRVKIAVIPWFEYGFASSYNQNGGHLLAKKPDWAACDRKGNLLKKNNFEWLNAFHPEVQEFLLKLILEVLKNYDVAGIQGDDRLPALPSEGGYDSYTVSCYQKQFKRKPPGNYKDEQWLQWRSDLLTDFLARIYCHVKAIDPCLLVSMAPSIYDWGWKEYLQDTKTWVDKGFVDLLHPQLYRRDFYSYKNLVDRLVSQQFSNEQLPLLIPGILLNLGSSYQIDTDYLLQAIAYNRDCGITGEVFFFYEGLRKHNNALAKVLRNGPYAKQTDCFTNYGKHGTL